MRALRNLKLTSKALMLIGLFVTGLGGLSVFFAQTLAELRVRGPIYDEVVRQKDIIADVLPPPKYIIESYLVVLQLLEPQSAAEVAALVARGHVLTEEYRVRHEFWAQEPIDPAMREWLLERSHRPAMQFFEVRDRDFVPAVVRGDLVAARAIERDALRPLYLEHRHGIDEVVSRATAVAAKVEAAATRSLDSSRIVLVAVGGGTLVGVALLTWLLFAVGLARPIRQTATVIAAVAKGDFTRRADIAGDDEIGAMGRALNSTLDDLERKVQTIIAVIERVADGDLRSGGLVGGDDPLGRIAGGLERLVDSVRRSIGELATHSNDVAGAAADLGVISVKLTESSTTASRDAAVLSNTSGEVRMHVATANHDIGEMIVVVREIAKHTGEATGVANDALQLADTAQRVVRGFVETSEAIGNVVKTIHGIAEKTNLLALNATIEAARAGASGRGFAVVASEVKDLARATAIATQEITERIDQIRSSTREASSAMTGIVDTIRRIHALQEGVAGAVEQHSATSGDIGRALDVAGSSMDTLCNNASTMAHASMKAQTASVETEAAAKTLRRMAGELRSIVSRFTVPG